MRPSSRLTLPVLAADASAPGCRDHADPHPDEFARGAAVWDERFSRRGFLATMGASLALAGIAGGCSDRPREPIVPYVDPPEQVVAGEPQFFATTLTRGGYGRGVIVTSREGRPIKIEGNPDHPASLGAADAQMQAAILGLYDPLRSNTVTRGGKTTTWGAFVEALTDRMAMHQADRGEGLVILTGAFSSPSMAVMLAPLKSLFPLADVESYEPLSRDAVTFGGHAEPVYDLTACDVVISFDADFLTDQPGSLAHARQFAEGRRTSGVRPSMNRLYAAEADFSVTGSKADHRLAIRPSRAGLLLTALAVQIGAESAVMPGDLSAAEAAWLSAVASDLAAHRGRSLVIVGDRQPAGAHATGLAINRFLENVGRSIRYVPGVLSSRSGIASLSDLVDRMKADQVRTLIILADNPVRTAPADLPFGDELERLSRRTGSDGRPLAFTACLGLYNNETAYRCQWHVPAAHELESWSDARAFDGTQSISQPLIAPLTGGRSPLDILNVIFGRPERSAYDTVRDVWRMGHGDSPAGFETWWTDTLRRGVVEHSAAREMPVEAINIPAAKAVRSVASGVEIVLPPDPSVGDGGDFHNPWLQELPRPLTKIVWGNAALIGPETAGRYDLQDNDVVRLSVGDRSVESPVLVFPYVAAGTVVLHLGYGQHQINATTAAASDANKPRGIDAYPLRTAASPGWAAGATLTKTGRRSMVVRTHNHHAMTAGTSADPSARSSLAPRVIATPATPAADLELRNRKLIRTATLAEFFKSPDFAPKMDGGEIKQLYPGWDYSTGPQWGMTIDLTTCIGCNACIVACQAENNTPTVGPDQVAREREMHWLRVDSYFDDAGRVHHQPVACMQCENAPCEYVCPVAATTHSVEGLNQMTYNRCVGTRYCSNNCPYKVRRFNFFNYTAPQPGSYAMQKNPDVTVRTRGVMEKCTYCVQRINYADRKTEIAALNAADRGEDPAAVRHDMLGRLQTACQQTCPTQAIHFGDLMNPNSAVTRDKHDPRNYGLLVELTTKPRTTYLASITNPSPSMEVGAG